MKRSLFLSGGGARGAYQVGVLQGIQEITQASRIPFDILSTVSAGAINGSLLAMRADHFPTAVDKLTELWSSLSCDDIYRANDIALLRSVARNISSMLFHVRYPGGQYLLDTSPLRKLLNTQLDFKRININIDTGLLSAFEVSTICYEMTGTVSFFRAFEHRPEWHRTRHFGISTPLQCHHVLASTAIPLFFPAVTIDNLHYGDGGMRQSNPLRSSIELGADSILIIGTKKPLTYKDPNYLSSMGEITFAKVLGTMFNTLFLDNVERDLDILLKINESIELAESKSLWRKINVLYITPSIDLGEIAADKIKVMPLFMRYLISAFGQKEQAGDFLSFLLFEAAYCKELIRVGFEDALRHRKAIEAFFAAE